MQPTHSVSQSRSHFVFGLISKMFSLTILLAMILGFLSSDIFAQAKKPQVKAKKKGEVKVADPEMLVLETRDKVQMKTTYFAPAGGEGEGEGGGKSVVPIILLHDWEGDRRDVLSFGRYLQKSGFAVIAPDLRGHGESTQMTGNTKKLDYKRFRKVEVATVQYDIERCKKYLVQRHNEGKLNVDLLTVVSVGKTCALAVQWTINDWYEWPAISSDGIKQGQDVKALVLISPRKKIETILLSELLKHPMFTGKNGAAMPMMVVWGKGKAAKDSEYLAEKLEKARPDLSEIKDNAERIARQTLFTVPLNQSFTGTEIVRKPPVKGLWLYMTQFVQNKVAKEAEKFPWKTRDLKEKEKQKEDK